MEAAQAKEEQGIRVRAVRAGLVAPQRASEDAAGFDLRAAKIAHIEPEDWMLMPTGYVWHFPPGCAGFVCPRSGLALRHGLTVLNAPGVIDADFEGEVCVLLANHGPYPVDIERGDRIAQLIVMPVMTDDLRVIERCVEGSGRGTAGFGSTGVR